MLLDDDDFGAAIVVGDVVVATTASLPLPVVPDDKILGAVWARIRPLGDDDDVKDAFSSIVVVVVAAFTDSEDEEDKANTSNDPVPFNSTIVPEALRVPTILPTNAVGMDGNTTASVVVVVTVVVGGAS